MTGVFILKNNKRIHNHAERTVKKTQPTFLKALVAALPVGIVTCIALVFVLSLVLTKLDDPEMFVFPAGVVCVAISSFLSAFVAVKIRKTPFALTSLCIGLVLFVLLFILSLTGLRKGQTDIVMSSIITVLLFLACLIGGKVASMQSSPRKKYARR